MSAAPWICPMITFWVCGGTCADGHRRGKCLRPGAGREVAQVIQLGPGVLRVAGGRPAHRRPEHQVPARVGGQPRWRDPGRVDAARVPAAARRGQGELPPGQQLGAGPVGRCGDRRCRWWAGAGQEPGTQSDAQRHPGPGHPHPLHGTQFRTERRWSVRPAEQVLGGARQLSTPASATWWLFLRPAATTVSHSSVCRTAEGHRRSPVHRTGVTSGASPGQGWGKRRRGRRAGPTDPAARRPAARRGR